MSEFVSLRTITAGARGGEPLNDGILKKLRELAQRDVRDHVEKRHIGKYRDPEAMEAIRRQVRMTVERNFPNLREEGKEAAVAELTNEVSGYGILEPLLEDPEITEILGERYDKITIEKHGRLLETDYRFESEEAFKHVIEKILLPTGRSLSWANPAVDARLADGSRVNIVGPPISPDGVQIAIRKFRKSISLETLAGWGALNDDILALLKALIRARFNIIVSGGTGSGKTTLLNAIAEHIDRDHSIITIENPIETTFEHPHVRRWEGRPASLEGRGEITTRFLVFNALRARPDRIIVGEVRGAEAFDMLNANITGHPGSLTTGHADSEDEMMTRLMSMAASAEVLAPELIPGFVAAAVDIVVQVSRLPDKSRKVVGISEVMGAEGGVIRLNPLIRYRSGSGPDQPDGWALTPHGFSKWRQFQEYGIDASGLWLRREAVS